MPLFAVDPKLPLGKKFRARAFCKRQGGGGAGVSHDIEIETLARFYRIYCATLKAGHSYKTEVVLYTMKNYAKSEHKRLASDIENMFDGPH